MRVVFVSLIPNSTWTGMGNWTHQIARQLESTGDTAVLWFEEDFTALGRLGPLNVLIAPMVVAARLVRFRKSFDVAVIHEPLGFWYALAKRLRRSLPGVVCVSHGVENRIFRLTRDAARSGAAKISVRTRMTYWLTRGWQSAGFLKLADRVICLCSADRTYIIERLGRAPSEVSFTLNGVDLPTSAQTAARKTQSVLFVGGWINNKGRWIIPAIWNAISEAFPRASLSLVGTGVAADAVLPSFQPGSVDRIHIIPRVTSVSGMQQIYEQHEVFFMPSLSEGSPLSLFEAMSHGLIVVASTAGGIPDMIEDGVTGLLFEFLDINKARTQLSRTLAHPDECRLLGENARRAAQHFSWKATAERVRPALAAAAESAGNE